MRRKVESYREILNAFFAEAEAARKENAATLINPRVVGAVVQHHGHGDMMGHQVAVSWKTVTIESDNYPPVEGNVYGDSDHACYGGSTKVNFGMVKL